MPRKDSLVVVPSPCGRPLRGGELPAPLLSYTTDGDNWHPVSPDAEIEPDHPQHLGAFVWACVISVALWLMLLLGVMAFCERVREIWQ